MGSLSTNENARFPVALDLEQRSGFFPPTSPASKPCSPCEFVRAPPRLPQTEQPILSWVSAPLELSPSAPRTLRPAQARRPEHDSSPEGLETRPKGPLDPPSQVRPPRTEVPTSLVGSTRPPSRPDRTASRRRPFSHGLGHAEQARRSLTHGAFKYVERSVSPKRTLALLGFLASSTTSRLWNLRRS
jgi:hypothetical protein